MASERVVHGGRWVTARSARPGDVVDGAAILRVEALAGHWVPVWIHDPMAACSRRVLLRTCDLVTVGSL